MGTGAVGKSAMRLQYLMAVADGTLAQVTDASVIANFLAIGGDVSDFSSTTDSLEAIANAVGGISTGDAVAEIGSFTGQTNLQTLLAALGIPDTSAKPLYTCLVTDRLDSATYGLSALRTQVDLSFLAAVGGALNTAAATGAVDNATTVMGYSKQLVTELIVVDGYHDIPTVDVADNAQMRDVIGNKTDAAASTADVVSLIGLTRKTLDEATETKRHHHNVERWFGPAASASGTTHVADPIGEVGGTPAGVITSFRVTTGANKTWGTALQVWGSTDYTLMPTGKQAFLDMHRFRVTTAETDRKNWYFRIIADDTSAAGGVTADTYGAVAIFVENTDKVEAPIEIITDRIAQTDGIMVWIQALNPDDNDADYIDLQFGIHGYPE